jgi:hypothetical protein
MRRCVLYFLVGCFFLFTTRTVKAGRHPHLDALAQKFYKAPSDTEHKSLHKEAKAVATQNVNEHNKKGGTYYLYVMDKVVSGPLGIGYVEKESKR